MDHLFVHCSVVSLLHVFADMFHGRMETHACTPSRVSPSTLCSYPLAHILPTENFTRSQMHNFFIANVSVVPKPVEQHAPRTPLSLSLVLSVFAEGWG